MAYDEALADRIRGLIGNDPDVTEKAVFGSLAFLVGGNMAVGPSGKGGLLVRVDPAHTAALLEEPHSEPFVMRGKQARGWLRVAADGVRSDAQLEPWVDRGVAFARSLPPKR